MNTERLQEQLELHEGVRKYPYKDTKGKITIGIGRNLSDKPLSDAAIAFLFDEDIAEAIEGLNDHLPWWEHLDEIRQRVMIDLTFNIGISGLLLFKRTLGDIKAGRFEDAALHLGQSLWAEQVGDGPGGKYDRGDRLQAMLLTGKDYTK